MKFSALMMGVGLAACLGTTPAQAHHSYAMFEVSKKLTVSGTVAKWGWQNPHTYLWVYVPNPKAPSGHDLYSFENGSTNILGRLGWSKTTFTSGEKVTVEYFPLKDGRTGGHLTQVTYPDGRVIKGAGGPGITGQINVVPTETEIKQ
jgi:hypothetical protein